MSSDLMLDVDQAGELKAAFRRSGWTNAEIKQLCEGVKIDHVREFLLGLSQLQPRQFVVRERTPKSIFASTGGTVEHLPSGPEMIVWRSGGELYCDGKRVELWSGRRFTPQFADSVRRAGNRVLNDNFLDLLSKHPELVPIKWRKFTVCFVGSIHKTEGHNIVKALRFVDEERLVTGVEVKEIASKDYPIAIA